MFASFFLWASKYEQWKNKAEEKTSSIPKIFGFQFANTAFLILLTNAWIPEVYFPYGVPVLASGYQDFDVWWYQNVGLTLIMTVLTNIFIPQLIQLYSVAMIAYRAYSDRNFTKDQRVTAQVL